MSTFDSLSDWRTILLDLAGESTTDTAGDFYNSATRSLVLAYHDCCDRHPWLWLRKDPPGSFVTSANITAGTVNVTNGSTAITFSVAPAVSVAGWKIVIGTVNEFYRIATHTAGATAATLDVAFAGTTNAAAAVNLYQDEYTLASDVRHIVNMRAPGSSVWTPISQRTEDWINDHYPSPTSAAFPPQYYARITETKIRFNTYPTLSRRIEYTYTFIPTDPDTAGVVLDMPRNYRRVVPWGGLYYVYLDKNDDRAGAAGAVFGAQLEGIIADDLRKRTSLDSPNHPAGSAYGTGSFYR